MAMMVAASSCGSPAKEPPARSVRDAIKEHAREDPREDAFSARADQARILGDSSARVWVIAVVDFQCGDCRRWYDEVLPALRTGPIASGQVRVALLQMPMASHLNATISGVAAVCAADEGKFWETASRIFATQDQWKDLPDARPFLDSVAIGTGVEATRHRQCTERARGMKLVQTDAERSQAAGVNTLPTFFIGTHRLAGYANAATFRAVLDSALAGR